AGLFAQPRL
uniref:CAPA-Periviscerokinin-2 n=1 Tax=Delia radicum TaxID=30064 RepID=PVK2_DELRA|nr:RecName: Full=CAPA-Periviscerokinin-2; Short=CAPA-PVK-2 [Delia radicum]